MSAVLALVPGAPAVVPGLTGAAATDCVGDVEAAAALLAQYVGDAADVTVVGAGPPGSGRTGGQATLRRWGGDLGGGIRVGQGPEIDPAGAPDALLLGWWWLDLAGAGGGRTFVPMDDDAGEGLGGSGVVMYVADGPAALSRRAPVPTDPRALELDAALADWCLAGGELPDPGAVVAEEIGWWSRDTWRRLADSREAGTYGCAGTRAWSPFGVGYHVAVWGPEG